MHFKAQGDRRVHLGNFFARHGQAEEIGVDAAVFFLISDPKRYTYSVDDPNSAIEKLTAAALRKIIASMDRDTALRSRDEISSQLCSLLKDGADVLGIRISRVELKDISRAPDSFTW